MPDAKTNRQSLPLLLPAICWRWVGLLVLRMGPRKCCFDFHPGQGDPGALDLQRDPDQKCSYFTFLFPLEWVKKRDGSGHFYHSFLLSCLNSRRTDLSLLKIKINLESLWFCKRTSERDFKPRCSKPEICCSYFVSFLESFKKGQRRPGLHQGVKTGQVNPIWDLEKEPLSQVEICLLSFFLQRP